MEYISLHRDELCDHVVRALTTFVRFQMFAQRNTSLFPGGTGTAVDVACSWADPSLNARYHSSLQEYRHGNGRRPLTPREAASLVQTGHFEETIRGLSFIINQWDLHKRLAPVAQQQNLSFADTLDRVIAKGLPVTLSTAERSVATMIHALRVLGLDSATHPGDRAVELLLPFADRLNQSLCSRFGASSEHYTYRVLGAASLIAAETSRLPEAQPCGVQILRAAFERNIPRVMITSHHSLGGDAVPLIAEHCAREGLLTGDVSCSRLGFNSTSADIFWVYKELPEAWLDALHGLAQRGAGGPGHLLIVEDTLGPVSDDSSSTAIEDIIRQAHADCPHFSANPLILARDEEEALRAIESTPLVGVVTDLFIPTQVGSFDKSCGEATVREVLLPYLEHSEIDFLLRAGRAIEGEVAAIMEREVERLISLG